MGSPRELDEPPKKKAISNSKSINLDGPNTGGLSSVGLVIPSGLLTGVPETTTEELRP